MVTTRKRGTSARLSQYAGSYLGMQNNLQQIKNLRREKNVNNKTSVIADRSRAAGHGHAVRVLSAAPGRPWAQRLIDALLVEKHEIWSTGKKYFDMTEYLEARAEEDNQEIETEIQKASWFAGKWNVQQNSDLILHSFRCLSFIWW